MSGIQYLSDTNFSANNGSLTCSLPGIAFVMFKTDACGICKQVMPVFQHLSVKDMRVTWGVVDMIMYRNLIGLSKTTNTPITAVPVMLLFVNGLAHANYKGKRDVEHITAFLNKIIPTINITPKNFVSGNTVSTHAVMQDMTRGAPLQPQNHPSSGDFYRPIEVGTKHATLIEKNIDLTNRVTPHNEPYLAKLSRVK